MEFVNSLVTAAMEHPMEAQSCIGFPVTLALLCRGNGSDGGWFDGDRECGV
ncbi:MAG: hypothetical protein AAGF27_05100 [Pseudomonadota bacterium]